jgi:hypothetical protein
MEKMGKKRCIKKRVTMDLLKSSIILIGLVVLFISIFGLPKLAAYSASANPEFAYLRWPVLFGLYLTEIPFYLALYHSIRLVGFIDQETAFSKEAVNKLKLIKINAWSITLMYLAGAILLLTQKAMHPGVAIIWGIIIFASVIISVFASVLQGLLSHASALKYENNQTV